VRRVEDGSLAQLNGLLHAHVEAIVGVEDSVGKGRAGAHREALPLKTGAIAVNVEEPWPLIESR
jgi:hypothetical protein